MSDVRLVYRPVVRDVCNRRNRRRDGRTDARVGSAAYFFTNRSLGRSGSPVSVEPKKIIANRIERRNWIARVFRRPIHTLVVRSIKNRFRRDHRRTHVRVSAVTTTVEYDTIYSPECGAAARNNSRTRFSTADDGTAAVLRFVSRSEPGPPPSFLRAGDTREGSFFARPTKKKNPKNAPTTTVPF